MDIPGSQVFRSGRSRPTYGRVQGSVTARLSDDGEELLVESSIPVSKGFSDVCFVLPVAALPELVRLGLTGRERTGRERTGRERTGREAELQNSES